MVTSSDIKVGACTVSFKGIDLGYTNGGVTITYSKNIMDRIVDWATAPIRSVVVDQKFTVKVPLAEYNLQTFNSVIPNSIIINNNTKSRVMSDALNLDLKRQIGELILKPINGSMNETITLHHAIPRINMSFTYLRDNMLIYNVTFSALSGPGGWVTIGDSSATLVGTPNGFMFEDGTYILFDDGEEVIYGG